jgi:hypothetical protein
MKKFFNEKLWSFETAMAIAVGYAFCMVALVGAAVLVVIAMM